MQKNRLPYLLMFLPPLFWAGNFVAGRLVSDLATPISFSFWRWTIALIFLLPFIVVPIWQQRAVIARHFFQLLILAALGIAGFNTLVYIALQDTTATNALLLNSFIPVFILLISVLFFHEAIAKRQIIGIVLSLTGVIVIITRLDPSIIKQLTINKGDLWMLLATLDWALYSILLKFLRPKDMSALAFLGVLIFLGTLMILPLYLINPYHELPWVLDNRIIKVILFIAIFPSIISYLAWNYGMQKIGASFGCQYIHLMPFFGAVLAITLLGEQIHLYHLIGGMFIALGLFLSIFKTKDSN